MIFANDCLILRFFHVSDGATREEVLMDVMNHQQVAREAQWMQANREELVERVARAIRADGTAQPLPGLHLYRHSMPLEQVYSVVEPSLCVVAQGSKEFMLGEDLDAASAAYRVGYHDASHFNREYKSLFGVPPMRDVQRLREEVLQSAGR
jgi:AraC-like DNA-binding protein